MRYQGGSGIFPQAIAAQRSLVQGAIIRSVTDDFHRLRATAKIGCVLNN
jgi:hypothetical protein